MKTMSRLRPALESLESRNLLSALAEAGHPGPAVAVVTPARAVQRLSIQGTIHGGYFSYGNVTVEASGRALVNGKVEEIHMDGYIDTSTTHRSGRIVVRVADGDVAASLSGTAAGSNSDFTYRFTEGTGRFLSPGGSGMIKFQYGEGRDYKGALAVTFL
jgi:hypothetical protein